MGTGSGTLTAPLGWSRASRRRQGQTENGGMARLPCNGGDDDDRLVELGAKAPDHELAAVVLVQLHEHDSDVLIRSTLDELHGEPLARDAVYALFSRDYADLRKLATKRGIKTV